MPDLPIVFLPKQKSHELDWEVDISGSINIPYTQLLKDGKFYPKEVKRNTFSTRETTNIQLWIRCNSLY
jgi:hypothetical protein